MQTSSPSQDVYLADLLLHARLFDAPALGELHDHFYPQLWAYLNYRLADPALCQALIDQVFADLLAALVRKRKFLPDLAGWFFAHTARLVDERLKAARKEARPADNLPANWRAWQKLAAPEAGSAPVWQPAQVRRALHRLSHEQQHFLALRFANHFTTDGIARLTGKTEPQVREIQFAALSGLSEALAE